MHNFILNLIDHRDTFLEHFQFFIAYAYYEDNMMICGQSLNISEKGTDIVLCLFVNYSLKKNQRKGSFIIKQLHFSFDLHTS